MKNLLQFFIRFHFPILFIALEFIAFSLLFNNNNFQRSRLFNFTHKTEAGFYMWSDYLSEYFMLRDINRELIAENVRLQNELLNTQNNLSLHTYLNIDTTIQGYFSVVSAKVINNSTNKRQNYITLNKGKNDGILPDMGVISPQGVVGIVQGSSDHFSTIIPLLNNRLKISAKLKKNNYFGSLHWDGQSPYFVKLTEIPYHVDIIAGDTIITSGYSNVFPEGIVIGYVDDYELKDGNFYEVTVKLSVDFHNIYYVQVINSMFKEEQRKLEGETLND